MSPKPSLGSAGSQGKGGLTAFKSIGHPAQSAPYCTHSGVLFTTIVNLSVLKCPFKIHGVTIWQT